MSRILVGALSVALLATNPVFAAAPTSVAHVDYAARCKSLADQWKTAETANASHASLGKAKAEASTAEKLCKSKKDADMRKGVSDYEAALKLLGVTPT